MDQQDLKQIGELIDVKLDLQLKKLEERLEFKATKRQSDLFDLIDNFAKEISDGRDFREISGHQMAGNTRRIEKLEKKVFGVTDSGV